MGVRSAGGGELLRRYLDEIGAHRLPADEERLGLLGGEDGVGRGSSGRHRMSLPMRDLVPDIVRRRLLVEGYFTADVDESSIPRSLIDLPAPTVRAGKEG